MGNDPLGHEEYVEQAHFFRALGAANEIAFVFAVFGVDDDYRPSFANGVDGFFDGGKGIGHVDSR